MRMVLIVSRCPSERRIIDYNLSLVSEKRKGTSNTQRVGSYVVVIRNNYRQRGNYKYKKENSIKENSKEKSIDLDSKNGNCKIII